MPPINEERRIEAYRTAAENIRALYVSDELTKLTDKIYITFRITEPFKALSTIIGDAILGFYTIADMPKLFQQKLGVSADESQRMVSQLIEILGPVVEREQYTQTLKKQELSKLRETFAQREIAGDNPKSGPEDVVEPIRTMAQDMSRVHGYGAYREELEKEEGIHQSSQTEMLKKEEN